MAGRNRTRRRSSPQCIACWRWRRAGLKLISPYDVIAETRQPNLPGTIDDYPNWRLPLPVTLEELKADPRVTDITAAFR
jgi:4-alpha-glucanotransferase